jgi:hypothetical protein
MTLEDDIPSGFPSAWYVCFMGAERRHWWDCLSPPGFYHVLAFAYAARAERWLIYDVGQDRSIIRALPAADFDRWISALPPGRTIVHFEAGDAPARPFHRAGFWCATAVAHLVGARTRALRPHALYRDLLAQGARPAFQEPEIAQPESPSP